MMTIYSDTLHWSGITPILTLLLILTLLPNLTFYLIVRGFHRTFATGAACQQRTLTPPDTWSCPIWDLQMFFCWDHCYSILHYTSLWHLSLTWLFTDFDVITEYMFPKSICNGCGMPTGDAYSSGHLVLSHFGTCKCSNVETNISWTCLVSGLLSFEHPSVLLFLLFGDMATIKSTFVLCFLDCRIQSKIIRYNF